LRRPTRLPPSIAAGSPSWPTGSCGASLTGTGSPRTCSPGPAARARTAGWLPQGDRGR